MFVFISIMSICTREMLYFKKYLCISVKISDISEISMNLIELTENVMYLLIILFLNKGKSSWISICFTLIINFLWILHRNQQKLVIQPCYNFKILSDFIHWLIYHKKRVNNLIICSKNLIQHRYSNLVFLWFLFWLFRDDFSFLFMKFYFSRNFINRPCRIRTYFKDSFQRRIVALIISTVL